jgi:hypothetical protein
MSEPARPTRAVPPWQLGVFIGVSIVLGTAVGNNVADARWAQLLIGAVAAAGVGLALTGLAALWRRRRG